MGIPYFRASASAAKLSLYEVLRRVRQQVQATVLGGGLRVTDFYQPAQAVTEHALDWLDNGRPPGAAPFFLFLHYMDPHDPFMDWTRPGVGYARVRMGEPDPAKSLDAMKKAYALEIEYLDQHLGVLFDGLRSRGLYDDSVILLTSDHGEEFYDHGGWWHGRTLYEEQLRVPLLVKLPGNEAGGERESGFARHIDVGPTLLRLAGTEIPGAMSGAALLGAGTPEVPAPRYVYAEVDFEGNRLTSARTSARKLIQANKDNPRGLAEVEYYDLATDPRESENLAGQDPADEASLRNVLERMKAFIHENAAEPSLVEETPAELEEQLESLGYLE